jgi:hypothetical protein
MKKKLATPRTSEREIANFIGDLRDIGRIRSRLLRVVRLRRGVLLVFSLE